MPIVKCKMCGGDMDISPNRTFGTCEHCGSTTTLPKVSDDQRADAFNQGNHLRRTGEFDRALEVYERIVAENETDAEAHWCCALCRFGIEYMEDLPSYEWVPICHRPDLGSFLEDADYLAAVEYSEGITRRQYQKEATKIAEAQRDNLPASRSNKTDVDALLQEAYSFLDEEKFDNAAEHFEKTLDQDPKNMCTHPSEMLAAQQRRGQTDPKEDRPPDDSTDDKSNEELTGSNDPSQDRVEQSRLEELYYAAVEAMNNAVSGADFEAAAELFQSVSSYKDAARKRDKCERLAEETRSDEEEHRYRAVRASKTKLKKTVVLATVVVVVVIAAILIGVMEIIPHIKYNEATSLYNAGDYDAAITAFTALGDYKDSAARAGDAINAAEYADAEALLAAENYDAAIAAFTALGDYKDSAARAEEAKSAVAYADAEALLAAENYDAAIAAFTALGDYKDSAARSRDAAEAKNEAADIKVDKNDMQTTIAAGGGHTVGLRSDGSVVAVGNNNVGQCNVSDWTDIVAVAAGSWHTVGLKSDGTVMAAGYDSYGQCEVSDWTDIVAMAAGSWHTVGLKSDGTVVAAGYNPHGQCDVSDWKDIVAVAAGYNHTVGLKADGTVVAVGYNEYGQCDVSSWTNIVAVAASYNHTVGLKADGTVVAVGNNEYGQCNVSDWKDIVAVAVGVNHTVGLRADGRVMAAGYNENGQCSVFGWRDIVAVAAGYNYTVGLKADGMVVTTGSNEYRQDDADEWTDIVTPAA